MGGPSHAVPEIDPPPVTFAPPPPPMGYENPIPTYPGSSGYNPIPAQDPYLEAAHFNALYPSPFPPAYPTGYPVQGYQYPPYQHQPQPPPQHSQTQEILQRLDEVEQKAEER
ncbi:extensin-1-like [Helianthus annuus]|uniref:extensin-1-like n=1 Tax=Helianthus annuus TaxID=4232 RepID=UPI000B8F95ED|nr:extensin-1-like [Helianthus annuus]